MKYYISVLFYIVKLLGHAESIDYDGWMNIKMEHSLNCNDKAFCHRGLISLKSIRSGHAVIEQIELNKNHIYELKQLADMDGFYSIKTTITAPNVKTTEFLSSVKAKAFLDNGLSDVISAWILPTGAVIAVNFQVTNYTEPLELNTKLNSYEINSNFYLRHIDQAPVPDTASYIQKLEREREAREKGELKDNRSFLAKYWMYIVPIAIFVMISGAANPEAQSQGSR